ncbi:S53 family peptidase [Nicoliella lavandulae]|uniref:S53 family peptidase n=1 Tax=Nicoliella lavandulae TaxID=3082954 RepID=A0ABU8SM57_9LACO
MRFTRIKSMLLAASVVGVGLTTISTNQLAHAKQYKISYKNVPDSRKQTIVLGLKGRNSKQLNQFINQTVTPGNANYRKYLTPQQFGSQYGLTDNKVKVIGKYMAKNHLKTVTYPGNTIMTVSGSAKNIEKVFHIKLMQATRNKLTYQVSFNKAHLTKVIAKDVYYIDQFNLNKQIVNNANNTNGTNDTSINKVIKKIKDPNISDRSYKKFGRTYNTQSLYDANYYGQNQTIGIIGDADFKQSDIKTYLKQQGVKSDNNRIKKVYVDHNLSKSTGDQGEVTMDVEQASAIAPKANINVYMGEHSNDDFALKSFATAIGRDNVDVISYSYGSVETDVKNKLTSKAELNVMNQLLKQAAAQGISVFNASGDNGAYEFRSGSKERTIGMPTNSPYITAVGGTTLPFKGLNFSDIAGFKPTDNKTVSLDKEIAWSSNTTYQLFGVDYIRKVELEHIANLLKNAKSKHQKETVNKLLKQIGGSTTSANFLGNSYQGSGGGISNYFATPDYQKGISGVNTYSARQFINLKTGMLNLNAPLLSGSKSGRNVPDISGNADSLTGYNVYVNGKSIPSGGTSIVTPQIAGMAAVINSAQGKRMGFWNPQIYRFAKGTSSPFTKLDSSDNENLYYVGQPGKLYNQTVGLGTVDFTKLNQSFSDEH